MAGNPPDWGMVAALRRLDGDQGLLASSPALGERLKARDFVTQLLLHCSWPLPSGLDA